MAGVGILCAAGRHRLGDGRAGRASARCVYIFDRSPSPRRRAGTPPGVSERPIEREKKKLEGECQIMKKVALGKGRVVNVRELLRTCLVKRKV